MFATLSVVNANENANAPPPAPGTTTISTAPPSVPVVRASAAPSEAPSASSVTAAQIEALQLQLQQQSALLQVSVGMNSGVAVAVAMAMALNENVTAGGNVAVNVAVAVTAALDVGADFHMWCVRSNHVCRGANKIRTPDLTRMLVISQGQSELLQNLLGGQNQGQGLPNGARVGHFQVPQSCLHQLKRATFRFVLSIAAFLSCPSPIDHPFVPNVFSAAVTNISVKVTYTPWEGGLSPLAASATVSSYPLFFNSVLVFSLVVRHLCGALSFVHLRPGSSPVFFLICALGGG